MVLGGNRACIMAALVTVPLVTSTELSSASSFSISGSADRLSPTLAP